MKLEGFGLRFHHLGLAVRSPETAFRFLAAIGYENGADALDPLQNVHVALRHHAAMPDVEVVWPGPGGSPIDQIIRRGHMIYHLCYATSSAEQSLEAIAAAGFQIAPLGPPKPAVLFGGLFVSFHSIEQFGMIELIHDHYGGN